jgi:hypothetical protein
VRKEKDVVGPALEVPMQMKTELPQPAFEIFQLHQIDDHSVHWPDLPLLVMLSKTFMGDKVFPPISAENVV